MSVHNVHKYTITTNPGMATKIEHSDFPDRMVSFSEETHLVKVLNVNTGTIFTLPPGAHQYVISEQMFSTSNLRLAYRADVIFDSKNKVLLKSRFMDIEEAQELLDEEGIIIDTWEKLGKFRILQAYAEAIDAGFDSLQNT